MRERQVRWMAVRTRCPEIPFISLNCAVWRIVVGLSLIPAFGTLYQRLTLPESIRYQESQNPQANMELQQSNDSAEEAAKKEGGNHAVLTEEVVKKKAHFRGRCRNSHSWQMAELARQSS